MVVALAAAVTVGVVRYSQPEDRSLAKLAPPDIPDNWDEWKALCLRQPANQKIYSERMKTGAAAVSARAFSAALERFFAAQKSGILASDDNWSGGKPTADFYRTNVDFSGDSPPAFQPFAQKLSLTASSTVVFMGDLHGDVRSLIAAIDELNRRGILKGLKMVNPDTHLVFLGDYTDRGRYGVEVIFTLLWLKAINPENVWIARGNHEDLWMIKDFGFKDELDRKFGQHYDINLVARLYDFLPAVIYVGSGGDYLQCNHGGMEPGYNPNELLGHEQDTAFQLIGELKQETFLKANPEMLEGLSPEQRQIVAREFVDGTPVASNRPAIFGFMWNDFSIYKETQFSINRRPTFEYSQQATEIVLKAQSGKHGDLRGVFRAHQHSTVLSPLMQRLIVSNGVFRHWQGRDSENLAAASPVLLSAMLEVEPLRAIPAGSVHTFNVSPDSIYGLQCGYGFATFGILRTAGNFEDWRLEVVPVEVDTSTQAAP